MTRPRPRGRVAVSVVAGGRLTACPLSTPKWLRRCSAFHRERWSEDSRKLAWAEAHSGDGTISTDVMFEIFVEIGYRETRQTMVEARDQWPGGKEPTDDEIMLVSVKITETLTDEQWMDIANAISPRLHMFVNEARAKSGLPPLPDTSTG